MSKNLIMALAFVFVLSFGSLVFAQDNNNMGNMNNANMSGSRMGRHRGHRHRRHARHRGMKKHSDMNMRGNANQ